MRLPSVIALAVGCAIAWADMRPGWDDTGVTAGALLVSTALASGFGIRWWKAALLVGVPLVVTEASSAGAVVAGALVFTFSGSLLGAGLRRAIAQPR